MASVQIENVLKSYDGQQILHGVSVDIEDGEFVVLVGPSGCGKSSLLRMIAGLEDISGGTIGIDNRVVNNVPPKERDISMVFQSYALYPHMTVAENMAFSMTLAGAGKAEKAKRVAETAELVGLTDYLDRHPRHLSGGQRQRVAMGRSIIRDPQVFLFDEPLSNLDAKLRVAMRAEIKTLHKRLKTTIVYVTHDQVEAMTMADKIVVMNEGVIEQIGAPLELYDNPVNLFVASFIGSPAMNFIEGTIKTEKSNQRFRSESGFDIPLAGHFDIPDQAKIVCGIRPEDFKVTSAGAGTQATIETTEPMGSETHILITTGSDNLVAVFHDRQVFNTDDIIYIQPNADHVHLFDATTGRRIYLKPS